MLRTRFYLISSQLDSTARQRHTIEDIMVSFVLVGSSLMSVAAGIYTLAAKRLPPIFPDGRGGHSAPEIEPAAVPQWGIGFIAFGLLLGTVSYLIAAYAHAA